MRARLIIILIALELILSGCAKPKRFNTYAFPPTPSGLNLRKQSNHSKAIVIPYTLEYLPSDFALTSIRTQAGNRVVLTWINGTPPFQPQSKQDVLASWMDFGPSTSLRSITNTIPYGQKGFFRVRDSSTNPSGSNLWVRGMVTTLAGAVAQSRGVAVDGPGNVLVGGDFNKDVDFGNGPISSHIVGTYDGYVAKYGSQGTLLWTKIIGGNADDSVASVAVDSRTNVIVAGYFSDTVDFGGVSLTAPRSASQTPVADMFVAKYSPAGTLIWVKQFGGSAPDFGTAIALHTNDDIFLTGWFGSATGNFGGIILTNLTGDIDFAVVKLSTNGTTQWAKGWGSGFTKAFGLSVDRAGDVIVTGQFSGNTDIGCGILIPTGFRTSLLAKYSGANGDCRWSKAIGGPAFNIGTGVTTDPRTGNIIAVGGGAGTIDFGCGPVIGSGGEKAYMAGYDSAGTCLWVNTFGTGGSSENSRINGVCMNTNGNLAFTAQKGGPWFVGGEWIQSPSCLAASYFVSGNTPPTFRWLKTAEAGSTGAVTGNSVALDKSGNVLSAGAVFGGVVNFGAGSVTSPLGAYSGFGSKYSK